MQAMVLHTSKPLAALRCLIYLDRRTFQGCSHAVCSTNSCQNVFHGVVLHINCCTQLKNCGLIVGGQTYVHPYVCLNYSLFIIILYKIQLFVCWCILVVPTVKCCENICIKLLLFTLIRLHLSWCKQDSDELSLEIGCHKFSAAVLRVAAFVHHFT